MKCVLVLGVLVTSVVVVVVESRIATQIWPQTEAGDGRGQLWKMFNFQQSFISMQNSLINLQEFVKSADYKSLVADVELLKADFKDTETNLDSMDTKFNNTENQLILTETELGETKVKFNNMKMELNNTKLTLYHTQTKLDNTEKELGKTKTKLDNMELEHGTTKTKLNDTEMEMEMLKVKLDNTEAELESTISKLDSTNTKLNKTDLELVSTQEKLESTEIELRKMEPKVDNTITRLEYTETELWNTSMKFASMETKLEQMEMKMENMNTKLKHTEMELRKTKTELQATAASAGSVFIRWGRTTCTRHSDLVYSGAVGGSWYASTGAASNALCLTMKPELKDLHPKPSSRAYLYGAEYQHFQGHHDQDIPCAVCHAPMTTTIMIPATRSCPQGWTVQYSGDLASGNPADTAASEYLCLDGHSEVMPGGKENKNGVVFYHTYTRCGSLPCPPFVNDKAVTCVVCSK